MLNKKEFVDMLSVSNKRTKREIEDAVDLVINGIKQAYKYYNGVKFVGFGTFVVRDRKGRMGKNPNTNEPIFIKSRKAPHFIPGKELKEILNYT